MADQENLVGFALVLGSHSWGAVGHARHGQTDRIRAFIQQPPDIGGRNVPFDEIAFDFARVTGDHLLRDPVVELVTDQERAEAVLGRNLEAIGTQDTHPGLAATAVPVFQDMDGRRALREAQLRRKGAEAGGACKKAAAGQYGHDLTSDLGFMRCHPAAFRAQPITRTWGTVSSGSRSAALRRPVTSLRTRISV